MIFEICASLATVIFALLVFYIIQTLKQLQKSIEHINKAVQSIEPKIEKGSGEVFRFIHSSNDLVKTANDHMKAFNPLCKSLSNIGHILQRTSNLFHTSEHTNESSDNKKRLQKEKLDSVIELVAMSILFWQHIKKRR